MQMSHTINVLYGMEQKCANKLIPTYGDLLRAFWLPRSGLPIPTSDDALRLCTLPKATQVAWQVTPSVTEAVGGLPLPTSVVGI